MSIGCPWASHGHPMGIPPAVRSPWASRGQPTASLEHPMGIRWSVHGQPMVIPRAVCGQPMGSLAGPWDAHGMPMGSPWPVRGLPPWDVMGWPWACHAYAGGIPQTDRGHPMGSSWAVHEQSVYCSWAACGLHMGCPRASHGLIPRIPRTTHSAGIPRRVGSPWDAHVMNRIPISVGCPCHEQEQNPTLTSGPVDLRATSRCSNACLCKVSGKYSKT